MRSQLSFSDEDQSEQLKTAAWWWRTLPEFDENGRFKEDISSGGLSPRLKLLREMQRLAFISMEGLDLLRHKLTSYQAGDLWVPVGGIKKTDMDIPPVITLLLVGLTGSGKSSLVNFMYSVLGRSGLIPFAQTSSQPTKFTTMLLEEHNVLRSKKNGFCVYDTRGLDCEKMEEGMEDVWSWMSDGVRHNQPCCRGSDDREMMEYSMANKYCKRRVNCVLVVADMEEAFKDFSSGDLKHVEAIKMIFHSPSIRRSNEKPMLILTHGDMLTAEERVETRVKLCESLGISETTGAYDIACLSESGILAEEGDPVSAFALTEAVYRSLLQSDRTHLPKRKFKDWVLVFASWVLCCFSSFFAMLANFFSRFGEPSPSALPPFAVLLRLLVARPVSVSGHRWSSATTLGVQPSNIIDQQAARPSNTAFIHSTHANEGTCSLRLPMSQPLPQESLEPPRPLPCIRFSEPHNPLIDHSFEQNYRTTCTLLLSQTRSRLLPKGLALHAHIIKSGINSVPLVCHHLINFYSKLQCPVESTIVFGEASVKSPTTWSSVISSLAQNESPFLALQYFREMIRSGVRPDDHTFPCATKSSAMLSDYRIGGMVHCFSIKTWFDSDVFVGSSLVDMYAKCGKIDIARKVFDEMPERNVVSWSGMICGYALIGEDDEALRLFKEALVEDLDVNDFTYSSVIRVCSSSTLLELGKQIHGLCLKTSYDSSSFVGSSLISLYSKCGLVEGAYQVFEEVPVKNLGMWNAMSIACAQHGHTKKVFDLFTRIERAGLKPNFITFLCVLYACSHAGLVQEGKHYFGLMKDYGIEPGDQHYASFVDCLGRAGKLQEALKVVEEMPMQPTESVWGALLTGCRIHRNIELAAYVADRVFELGPVSPGLHVLLSNTYAAASRYEDAAKARKMLREQGVRKETGLSWVEEGNRVHTFATGDRRHAKYKEIYQKLEELGDEMERAGYVADTNFVLQQVGDQERSEAIRYHSERIAIAFALITFPPERPIRVMKNLRVCGDCHNAIKFMSKCTGRIIIVRDNNRFHRFENGKCTCSDYW